ncbi:hypothetical protein [Paenibacillus sp. A14]
MNEKTVRAFLHHVIKARLAISYMEQLSFAATLEQLSGTLRFNLWDGTLLQKLLFKQGFERKPVSLRLFHTPGRCPETHMKSMSFKRNPAKSTL